MAVNLNMIPVDQQQMTALQNTMNKDGTKSRKSEIGFAKVLHIENDKSGIDVDPKLKNSDAMQLMATMAGMVAPAIVNLMPVDQVVGNTADDVEGNLIDAQVQLSTAVPVIPQAQLSTAVPVIPQAQLSNAVPVIPQAQLPTAVPVIPQAQLSTAVPVIPQAQLPTAVSVIPQAQLSTAVPVIPQAQLSTAVPVIPQAQLSNAVPVIPQVQLPNAVPVIQQTQLSNPVSRDIGLATLLPQRTTVNAQVENTQLDDFAELRAQTQLQMQNKPILGQVEVTEVSKKNTEMLTNDPVLANSTPFLTAIGNSTIVGKNSNKQLEGKKIVASQVDVEATEVTNTFGLAKTLDVKTVLAPQMAVAVVDRLSSENPKNVDVSLPNQTVKDSDIFASMLNQQGVKFETQSAVEVKSVIPQPVSDAYNITSQIIDQARLVAGTKNTEMIIRLKPEHLGELTFKVSVENGIVSATFHSNNPEVRSIIESSLYQLKQEMSNQGLKIDNVGVYAGLGQFFSNGQQSGSSQQPVVKVLNKKNEEDFLEVFDTTDSAGRVLNETGIDYRA